MANISAPPQAQIAENTAAAIAADIRTQGALSIADYMARANRAYYTSRMPFGREGDFVTAPDISQMFGEMVGLWLADMWLRAGKVDVHYVELGAGRGTLARDSLAAFSQCSDGWLPTVHYVETSPALQAMQAAAVEAMVAVEHHSSVATLPTDKPLLIVANEFFDALPIRQFVSTERGWRERVVGWEGDGESGRLVAMAGDVDYSAAIPHAVRRAPVGAIYETAPMAQALIADLAARLASRQGGAMLIIDYGYAGPAIGDTLQAVARHAAADIFANVGAQDLSAHVDFSALAAAAASVAGASADAQGSGAVHISALVEQGAWLQGLGIEARLAQLCRANPTRSAELQAQYQRLTSPQAMGTLFKVMSLYSANWVAPAGFA